MNHCFKCHIWQCKAIRRIGRQEQDIPTQSMKIGRLRKTEMGTWQMRFFCWDGSNRAHSLQARTMLRMLLFMSKYSLSGTTKCSNLSLVWQVQCLQNTWTKASLLLNGGILNQCRLYVDSQQWSTISSNFFPRRKTRNFLIAHGIRWLCVWVSFQVELGSCCQIVPGAFDWAASVFNLGERDGWKLVRTPGWQVLWW